jgi:hypothetical protein
VASNTLQPLSRATPGHIFANIEEEVITETLKSTRRSFYCDPSAQADNTVLSTSVASCSRLLIRQRHWCRYSWSPHAMTHCVARDFRSRLTSRSRGTSRLQTSLHGAGVVAGPDDAGLRARGARSRIGVFGPSARRTSPATTCGPATAAFCRV